MLDMPSDTQDASLQDIFAILQDNWFDVFKRRNAAYGDSFAEDRALGVLIRMTDKINRALHLAKRAKNEDLARDESLIDTLGDLSNYCLMAIIAGEYAQAEALNLPSPLSDTAFVFHQLQQEVRQLALTQPLTDPLNTLLGKLEDIKKEISAMKLMADINPLFPIPLFPIEFRTARQRLIEWSMLALITVLRLRERSASRATDETYKACP